MQRLTLGDFELTIVSDGTYYLDGGALFGVVPKLMWERKMTADPQNRVPVGLNSLLVRTGTHTVLVETGIGNKLPAKMAQIYGQPAKLLENLAAAGVKAKYYVQVGEWRHASRQLERDRVSYISHNYDPLIQNGQMRLLQGDQEIVPGISVKVYPGHTHNMQAVMVTSQGQKACYISDLIPTTAHLDLTWVMAFDLFPLETIESRKRFYESAIPGNWLVVFTHDPTTPWAFLNQKENKVIVRPVTLP